MLLIASAKSQSSRGASHQPVHISGHLTTSDTCLPCLLIGRRFLLWSYLFCVGRKVSWERWKISELGRWEGVSMKWSSKAGKVCERSEVTSWEGWENNEVVRWERWEHNKGVAIWGSWEGGEQGKWDGISGENCVVLLQGNEMYVEIHCRNLNNSHLMFWVIVIKWISVA